MSNRRLETRPVRVVDVFGALLTVAVFGGVVALAGAQMWAAGDHRAMRLADAVATTAAQQEAAR